MIHEMDTREDRVFAQFQKVCQKVWLSSKSMPVYITLKKCSTQYVAHFMWLTKSLKIGEYATICSTLYVLPLVCRNVIFIFEEELFLYFILIECVAIFRKYFPV